MLAIQSDTTFNLKTGVGYGCLVTELANGLEQWNGLWN